MDKTRMDLTVFEYLYRDAGNFKTWGKLLLSGEASDAEDRVRRCLEWGDQFVAEQIGVPSLCNEHWEAVGEGPSNLDHAFHEFAAFWPVAKDERSLPVWGSLSELLDRMEKAARRWDVALSPNCDL